MENDLEISGADDVSAETSPAPPPKPAEAINPPGQPSWHTPLFWALLAATLLLAGFFRFTGLNWDDYTHLHPDERFLTLVADRIESEDSFLDYLRTSQSTLNPHNILEGNGNRTFPSYVYGNFPMTVTRYIAEWVAPICAGGEGGCELFGRNANLTGYDGVHFVGRFLSGLVDLISLGFLFLIGKRLYGRWVGLLAAFLFAMAVQSIQQSHFFTVDNWSVMFTTVAVYCAIRASEHNRYRWYAAFGLFLGLGVASRINVAPLAVLAGLSALIWLSNRIPDWATFFSRRGWNLLLQATACVMLAALCSIITFRLAQPYAFADITLAREMVRQDREIELGRAVTIDEVNANDPDVILNALIGFAPQWLANIEEIQRLQKPDAVFPPAVQWVDRPAIIFPATNMIFWGMGIGAGLAAFFGCFWALLRVVNQKPHWQAHVIPVSWSLMYFLFIGTRWVKNNRYFLPIYPTLLLMAAWGLVMLWRRSQGSQARRTLVTLVLAGVIGGSFIWASTYTRIYRQPNTRIAASEWFLDNIPSATTLIYDVGDTRKEAQLPAKNFLFQTGGQPFFLNFEMPESGSIVGVRFNYLTDEQTTTEPIIWQASLRVENTVSGQFEERDFHEVTVPRNEPLARDSFEFGLQSGLVSAETIVQLQIDMPSGGVVIADTSRVMNESWDDALPVRVDNRDAYGSYFAGVQDEINNFDGMAPVIHPDSPDKLNDVVRWLDQADVVVLSSQRAMWSLPRIPLTYPLMIRYYETLFSGELGFELAQEFHADTSIGPLYVSDVNGTLSVGRPDIGWPPPSDFFSAEEAFSVYDHPPVWIFTKTDDFTTQSAFNTLSQADVQNTVFMNPGQATSVPDALMLPTETFEQAQANGSFEQVFAPDSLLNRQPLLGAAVWYLFIMVMQLLAFPLIFPLLKHLPSRGYVVARIFGILLLSYFVWITGSLGILPANGISNGLGLVLLALACGAAGYLQRGEIGRFLRENQSFIRRVELLSLSLFLISLVIRYNNPDVWHVIWGGEKPMDLSYFTATMKSVSFPPYDPWYAGGALNYYYYGFVYVGVIAKTLSIAPTIAYNLAIPMLFSFTGMGAFSVAYDLVEWRKGKVEREKGKGMIAGMMAIVLAVLVGNLAQVGTIVDYLSADYFYPGNWFFSASRAIAVPEGQVAPITEFPFFTFLYGDLHAHMIALPLTMLALTWVIAFALRPLNSREEVASPPRPMPTNQRSILSSPPLSEANDGPIEGAERSNTSAVIPSKVEESIDSANLNAKDSSSMTRRNDNVKGEAIVETAPPLFSLSSIISLVIGGLLVGVLYPTNSWDWPTYIVLATLGILLFNLRRFPTINLTMLGHTAIQAAVVAISSYLFFLPFHQNFGAGFTEIGLWAEATTGLVSYLAVYGFFLFFTFILLSHEIRAWFASLSLRLREQSESFAIPIFLALVGLALSVLAAFYLGYQVALLAIPLIVIPTVIALNPKLPANRRIALGLVAAAFGLTLLVEIFVIEGTVGRMNTVFKFYMQVWMILSVIGGVGFAIASDSISRWGNLRRGAFMTGFGVLLFIAALYPVTATRAKWQIRMSNDAPKTLNGMAFMQTAAYDDQGGPVALAPDYEAIKWIQRNVDGSPVIAEAYSHNFYRSIGNRIAMYTGNPAIIGWSTHQGQQRAAVPGNGVQRRIGDVELLYNTPDADQALAIINKYDVSYVYVGALEQAYYDGRGLLKFERMAERGLLEQVYSANGVSIFKVMPPTQVAHPNSDG